MGSEPFMESFQIDVKTPKVVADIARNHVLHSRGALRSFTFKNRPPPQSVYF